MRGVPPELVEVSVVGGGCRSHKGRRVHRIKAIDKRELRNHERLRVSSPARVVLEVAAVGTRDELVDVIDAGLALRRFTPGDMKFVLERHRGTRGAGYDVLRPTRAHVVHQGPRVPALLAQALAA